MTTYPVSVIPEEGLTVRKYAGIISHCISISELNKLRWRSGPPGPVMISDAAAALYEKTSGSAPLS